MGAAQFDLTKDNPNGNFAIEEGATFALDITYKDSNGDVVDLSTHTARMKIRQRKSDTTALADWDTVTEITLAATSPNISIRVAASATAALDWTGDAYYDLELDDGGGTPVVTRLIEGRAELSKEVTYT